MITLKLAAALATTKVDAISCSVSKLDVASCSKEESEEQVRPPIRLSHDVLPELSAWNPAIVVIFVGLICAIDRTYLLANDLSAALRCRLQQHLLGGALTIIGSIDQEAPAEHGGDYAALAFVHLCGQRLSHQSYLQATVALPLFSASCTYRLEVGPAGVTMLDPCP